MPKYDWTKRANANWKRYDRIAGEALRIYQEAQRRANATLDAEIAAIFRNFIKGRNLTAEQAARLLNDPCDTEIDREIREAAAKLNSKQAKRMLSALSDAEAYRFRMTRAQALKSAVANWAADTVTAKTGAVEEALRKTYKEASELTAFSISEAAGKMIRYDQPSSGMVRRALSENWAGGTWSSRLWKQSEEIGREMQKAALDLATAGKVSAETQESLLKQLREEENRSEEKELYLMHRATRTEAAHVANLAQADAYEDAGIEKYEYISRLEARTCDACGELDGKIFPLKDAREGVNYPVMHPWCRCTTAPVIPGRGKDGKLRWARDPETGKEMKVPAGMTFQEWKQWLEEGKPDAKEWLAKEKAESSAEIHTVGTIDRGMFKQISEDITTDEVIITDERIRHSNEHGNAYDKYGKYINDVVRDPEYIFEDKNPNTAILVKEIKTEGKSVELILRLHTSSDTPGYKNSVLSYWDVGQKTVNRYIKSKKMVYKK